jgi:hypothetical protein
VNAATEARSREGGRRRAEPLLLQVSCFVCFVLSWLSYPFCQRANV